MTFWLSVSSFAITTSVFFPALFKGGKAEEVWCKNEAEGFKQEDGFSLCAFQGNA